MVTTKATEPKAKESKITTRKTKKRQPETPKKRKIRKKEPTTTFLQELNHPRSPSFFDQFLGCISIAWSDVVVTGNGNKRDRHPILPISTLFCFPCENRIPKTGVSTLRLIFVILPGMKNYTTTRGGGGCVDNLVESRFIAIGFPSTSTAQNRLEPDREPRAPLCTRAKVAIDLVLRLLQTASSLIPFIYTHSCLFHHILPNSFSLCSTIFRLFCAQDNGPEREDSARK